jgi:hypothetical protein
MFFEQIDRDPTKLRRFDAEEARKRWRVSVLSASSHPAGRHQVDLDLSRRGTELVALIDEVSSTPCRARCARRRRPSSPVQGLRRQARPAMEAQLADAWLVGAHARDPTGTCCASSATRWGPSWLAGFKLET